MTDDPIERLREHLMPTDCDICVSMLDAIATALQARERATWRAASDLVTQGAFASADEIAAALAQRAGGG